MRTLFFLLLFILPITITAQYVGPPMTTVELGILDHTSKISKKKFSADKVCTEDKSYCYEAIALKDTSREKWMGEIVQFRVGRDYIPTDENKIYTGIKITNDKNQEMNLMGTSSLKSFKFSPGVYNVPREYSKLFSSSGDYKFINADIEIFETKRPKFYRYTIPSPKAKNFAIQDLSNYRSLYTQHYDDQFLEIVQHKTHGTYKIRRYDLTKQSTMQEIELDFEEELHNIYSYTESGEHMAIHYFTKDYKAGTVVLYNNTEYNIKGEEGKHILALFRNGDYWYKIITPKGEKTQLRRAKRLQGEYEKVKEIPEALQTYSRQPYYFNSANDTMNLGKSKNSLVFSDYSVFSESAEYIRNYNSKGLDITVNDDRSNGINIKVVRDNITKILYINHGAYLRDLPIYKNGENIILYFSDHIINYDKRRDQFTYFVFDYSNTRSFSNYNSFQVGKYYYSLSGGRLVYMDFSEIKLPL